MCSLDAASCHPDHTLLLLANTLRCKVNPGELSLERLIKGMVERVRYTIKTAVVLSGLYLFCFVSTDDSVLHLSFYYLMNLNIMTVKTKVSTSTDLSMAISAGCVSWSEEFFTFSVFYELKRNLTKLSVYRELLQSDTLLSCLYTSDQGRETPNPANRYQFDKVG